jgi:phosphate/sulfate permease
VSDAQFFGYIALLFVSAVLLTTLAIFGFGQSTGARVVDGIFAAAFLGYSVYLLLFFESGNVQIFFYAFLVPVFAVFQMLRGRRARRAARSAPPIAPQ